MSAFDTYCENYEHEDYLKEMEREEQAAKRRTLKPCRNCGGEAKLVEENKCFDLYSYHVACTKCNNQTKTFSVDLCAVDEWNKE